MVFFLRDRTEFKKMNFVAASRPDCDRLTGDKVLHQISNSWIVQLGRWWEVSSMLGQLLTSAEIEEVRGLSCGALDPEFNAEEERSA